MTLFKFTNDKTRLLLSVILLFFITTGAVLFLSAKKKTVFWKTYKNLKLKYEIQYPSSWYIKEDQSGCGFQDCLESLYIQNKIGKVIVAGGGLPTENGSFFKIVMINAPGVSSIEEWIQSLYFSSNEKVTNRIKQRRLDSVGIMEVGGIKRNVWRGSGWADAGVEFVHDGKLYRLHYMSGSQKQFNKDLDTFEKILASFRILE